MDFITILIALIQWFMAAFMPALPADLWIALFT